MVVSVLLTSLTKQGKKNFEKDPGKLLEYNKHLEALGIRVIGQYVLVGKYDLLEIFEGESTEAIYKAGLGLADRETQTNIALIGMSIEDFVKSRNNP
ncbi:GYD domain-containing protein [Chloroflexota bacterium]